MSTGIVAALTLGAGYVAASAFDWLPVWMPSAQKVCRKIRKALPQQTFGAVAGEVALGLVWLMCSEMCLLKSVICFNLPSILNNSDLRTKKPRSLCSSGGFFVKF